MATQALAASRWISLRTATSGSPGFRAGGVAALADIDGVLRRRPAADARSQKLQQAVGPCGTKAAAAAPSPGLYCAALSTDCRLNEGPGSGTTGRTLNPKRLVRRIPVGAARGHDPCRHSNSWPGLSGSATASPADRFRQGLPPEVAGLRKVARRDRRRHPPGLRRGWLADEQKETPWISWPVPSAGSLSRGSPVGGSSQTTAPLPLWRLAKKACRALRSQAHRTQALHAADQREGPNGSFKKPSWRNGAYVESPTQTSDERNRCSTRLSWGL